MGSVLSYPVVGPEVCRKMISIILSREIREVRIVPQKAYFGADTDKHGIRLDVYAEEIMRTDRTLEPENEDSSKWYFVEVIPTSFTTISRTRQKRP